MKLREQKWLNEKINTWVSAGVINEKDASNIKDYEVQVSSSGVLSAIALLAGLGGLLVALGVVFLISVNWEEIPSLIKVACFLLMLIFIGESSVRASGMASRSAALIVWMVMPLAGMGLYGQIFHISGDPFKPLFVCLILTLPLVWTTKNPAAACVHTISLAVAAWLGAFNANTLVSLHTQNHYWWYGVSDLSWVQFLTQYSLACLILAMIWTLAFIQARKFMPFGQRILVLLAFVFWMWRVGVWGTIFSHNDMVNMFSQFGAALMLFWVLKEKLKTDKYDGQGWGLFMTAGMYYALTFVWRDHDTYNFYTSTPAMVYSIGVLIISLGLLAVTDFSKIFSQGRMALALKILVVIPALISYFIWLGMSPMVVAIVANFGLLSLCVWLVMEGMYAGRHRLINAGVVMLGILIITRFIDHLGSLLASGEGFIITGVIVLGLAGVLNIGRKNLLQNITLTNGDKHE